MVERLCRVELAASFLERLDAIEAFLAEANAGYAFDQLLDELRGTVIRQLQHFPRIGGRYLDNPPQSAEALTVLASLPTGAPDALREYREGDYLMLYMVADEATVRLLSIRHLRDLSFDLSRVWPTPV